MRDLRSPWRTARYRSIKRIASAVGDGATAVRLVHEYLDPDESSLAVRT